MSNNNSDIYNKVVTSPSLLISGNINRITHKTKESGVNTIWIRNSLEKYASVTTGKIDGQAIANEGATLVGDAFETYVLEMVANCASKLYLPHFKPSQLSLTGINKRNITKTLQSKISFLDTRQSLLLAIMRYLKPVIIKNTSPAGEYETRQLVWNLYLLILGARTHSEVVVSPKEQLQIIQSIKTESTLSSEAKARLAVIEGVYRSYSKPEKIPGFKFYPSGQSLYERLEDIVDDANLMEASTIRRLFSLRSNYAKLRKSLRQLTNFIATHSAWAKGIVKAAEFTGYIPSGNPLNELIDSIPLRSAIDIGPICLDPVVYKQNITSCGRNLVEFYLTPDISGEHFFDVQYTEQYTYHSPEP